VACAGILALLSLLLVQLTPKEAVSPVFPMGTFQRKRVPLTKRVQVHQEGVEDKKEAVEKDSCNRPIYDENGKEIGSEYDKECDGIPEICFYREAGEGWSRFKRDTDCDGFFESCSEVFLNAFGEVVEGRNDHDCDGTLDDRYCINYEYNEFGEQLTVQNDKDCNGESESCFKYGYDEDGNRTYLAVGENCDEMNQCAFYEYSEGGDLVSDNIDVNCDGYSDICNQYTYHGGEVTNRKDKQCDGTVDSCSYDVYDESQRLTGVFVDSDCNGEIELCEFYGFDEKGKKTITEFKGKDCDRERKKVLSKKGNE
jgi:hypothetical protein